MLKRSAKALWKGTGLQGTGTLETLSGAFRDLPYSAKTRFQNEDGKAGTNPEELIGAAHSGCFSMALAFQVDAAGLKADSIETRAFVTMDKVGEGWEVQKIELNVEAQIPGISNEQFQKLAETAKANCPVSKALSALSIEMTARLLEAGASQMQEAQY